MSHAHAKRLEADAQVRLAELGLVLRRTSDAAREHREAIEGFVRIRGAWEQDQGELPNTDVAEQELSVAEAVRAALTTDFVLRRTPDGIEASRPVAVDALRLSHRLSAALLVVLNGDIESDVPRTMYTSLRLLAWGSFDLSRCLVGYLLSHLAPDVDAGRDSPDAWLDYQESSLVRRRELQSVIRAHEVLRRFRSNAPDEWTHSAREYAQRVTAAVQVASLEVAHDEVPDRVRDLGWLDAAALDEAKALFSRALKEADQETVGQCLSGKALVDWVEFGTDNLVTSLNAAADQLSGRNRIGLLRTLLGFVDDPVDLEAIVLRILADTDKDTSEDGLRMRADALPQVLQALGQIGRAQSERIPALARRVAGWPASLPLRRDHLWLIPSVPCCAVLENCNGETLFTELPGLSDQALMVRLSNDHAEEFEAYTDLGTLRKELSKAIEPLRDQLSASADAVTYYSFGHLKHLPLAGLTGRNSILAVQPGVHVFAPVPPRAARRDSPTEGRVYLVDRSIPQSARLVTSPGTRLLKFDSRDEATAAEAEMSVRALMTSRAREVLVFCHGHVDQFRFRQSGLVAATAEHGVPIIHSSWIAAQNLEGTDLAVVLACGAGQGNVFVEPSLSIGYALRMAGAKVVIAPQWPILAVAAFEFANRFFALVDAGSNYSQAWSAVLKSDPNRFLSIELLED